MLTGGGGRVDLVALAGVRVTSGAEVYWDDPALNIIGPPPCITVEAGGTLRIQNWHPMMADGTMPTTGMIRVEVGGVLQVAEGLKLPADMVTVEGTPPDIVVPLPPGYEPEPEPELFPIDALHEPIPQVESVTGKIHVEVAMPNTVQVRLSCETGRLAALAVEWDLSSIPFETPGTYTVYGDFLPDGLSYKGISNPKGLRPVVSLTILASNPVWDLVWGIIEPVSDGVGLVRLAFSPLPEDVEHLYLQRSTDGVRWSRCARQNRPQDADLLSDVTTRGGMSFLTSRQRMEPTGFYLRLEVVGSTREGTSNIIYIPAVTDGDNGDSSGNRGGGQGDYDREGQKDTEQASSSSEAVVDTTVADTVAPQEAQPEQEPRHQPKSEAEQAKQESSLGGSAHSGVESGNSYLSWKPVQTIFSEDHAAEGDVPKEQQPADEDAHLNQVTEESQPPASPEESAVQAHPLAVESEYTAPTDDGDTSGLVAAATMAVCLFTAAGLYLLQKRSLKRKS